MRPAGSSWLPARLVHKQPPGQPLGVPPLGIAAASSQSHAWSQGRAWAAEIHLAEPPELSRGDGDAPTKVLK